MPHVLHRALPFVIAFVFGVTCTAIVRSVLPTHRRASYENGRPRCKAKARTKEATGHFVAMGPGSTAINITEIGESGDVSYVPFTLGESYSYKLTLKEQALLFRSLQEGTRSSPGFVVSYVSPEAIDGVPVTSDAVVFDIPRPRFWRQQNNASRLGECNVIARVELDASGTVSTAESVPGYAERCPFRAEVLDAAKQISFRPAFRNGVPVTQKISIMYRLQ
jgi:hypothetical protein